MLKKIVMVTMAFVATASAQQKLASLRDTNPFPYNLGIKIIPSSSSITDVTICCHGYGHNNEIINVVKSFNVIPGTLIGFNFPDYNINPTIDHTKAAYGTVHEILPLLYILKRCVHDLEFKKINLYGFSAGGGAVINTLAALTRARFNSELQTIGITQEIQQEIMIALQRGLIILDCPLKSWKEIGETTIPSREFKILATSAQQQNMNPIDTLTSLKDLPLNILLHFQKPDQILGNRDDALFIERLRTANSKGTTTVVIGSDGGHNAMHTSLWNAYKKLPQPKNNALQKLN